MSTALTLLEPDQIDDFLRDQGSEVRQRLRALQLWLESAEAGHSKNTWRAWRADWRVWISWCAQYRRLPLPAQPEDVARFVREMGLTRDDSEPGLEKEAKTGRPAYLKSAATVSRYLATIDRLHLAAGIQVPPGRHEPVRLALRAVRRHQTTDQDQAWGFQWATVSRILEALERQLAADSGNRLQILRDRALLLTGYDLLARREELAVLTWGRGICRRRIRARHDRSR